MSGSQSLWDAVKDTSGTIYIPVDKKEMEYSLTSGQKVRNLQMDIMEVTPQEVMEKVAQAVKQYTPDQHTWTVVWVWASPPCQTFSRADSSNKSRGNNYRDFIQPDRPTLHPEGTKMGDRARLHDEVVQKLLKILQWFNRWSKVTIMVENPQANLQHQQYMKNAETWLRKIVVHYCAYDHQYHKPTNIWTNLTWEPKGLTGNGRCGLGCTTRTWNPATKRWRHKNTIAQASRKEVAGRGRQAHKSSVPRRLLSEIWSKVLARQGH